MGLTLPELFEQARRRGLDAELRDPNGDAARAIIGGVRVDSRKVERGDLFVAVETDRVFRIPALRLAEAQLDHADDVFVYRFDWESPALGGALGACHAIELGFVFGVLDKPGMDFLSGKGPEAERLSETAMDAWLAFARTGQPGHAGLPFWPEHDSERRPLMALARRCRVEPGFGDDALGYWRGDGGGDVR